MLGILRRDPSAAAARVASNLDCDYCYFLSKEMLSPGSRFRMAVATLETCVRQYMDAQPTQDVTFAWQGGEPTLMGLEFFELVVRLQREHARPGQRVFNTLHTNGTQLDDAWCRFLRRNDVLVGISIDGPKNLHDVYRVDKGGHGSFDRVMDGLALLRKHGVEFNVLTTVHRANESHPLEVYRFLRDDIGAGFVQFIPIEERDNETGFQEGNRVTDRSVTPRGYGTFLTTIFDEWAQLCEGYKSYFTHTEVAMQFMANELAHKRPPANIMEPVERRTRPAPAE